MFEPEQESPWGTVGEVFRLVRDPIGAMENIADRGRLGSAVVVAVGVTLLRAAWKYAVATSGGHPVEPSTGYLPLLFGLLLLFADTVVSWLIWSVLFWLGLRVVGGEAPFRKLVVMIGHLLPVYLLTMATWDYTARLPLVPGRSAPLALAGLLIVFGVLWLAAAGIALRALSGVGVWAAIGAVMVALLVGLILGAWLQQLLGHRSLAPAAPPGR